VLAAAIAVSSPEVKAMRPSSFLLVALLLSLPVTGAGQSPPPMAPYPLPAPTEEYLRSQVNLAAMTAFLNGDFAALEAMAGEFDETARTPSGLWKRALMYGGIVIATEALGIRDDTAWAGIAARIDAWQAAFPQSPTVRLVRAEAAITRAWAFRGTCYARCVDAADWAPFHAHIEQARELLERDKAVAAGDAHWYQLMAVVATTQDWPEDRYAAFEAEALDKAAGYYDAAFSLGGPHQPKWGGSAEAVEAYAQRLVERTKAKEGEGMYARLYWSLIGPESFDNYAIDWARMKRAMDDVLARYPDPWNLNHFAAIACRADRPEIYRELLPRIDTVVPVAWQSQDLAECRARADAGH
jgi:hypothetical protein